MATKIAWLIAEWNKRSDLPKIRRSTTRARVRDNIWVRAAVSDISQKELLQVLDRYALIRRDPDGRFFRGFKKWSLLELFSRKKGEYVDHLLEGDWERSFLRIGKKEREIPIGESSFGGYVPKTEREE